MHQRHTAAARQRATGDCCWSVCLFGLVVRLQATLVCEVCKAAVQAVPPVYQFTTGEVDMVRDCVRVGREATEPQPGKTRHLSTLPFIYLGDALAQGDSKQGAN